MEINKILEGILKGEAILFCGSGFSRGATNIQGEELASVSILLKKMCEEIKIDYDDELEYVSEEYIKKLGENRLIQLLKNNFTTKQVKEYHENIINLPWRRIYTSNYDDVIEKSNKKIYKKSITLNNEPYKISLSEAIIHLNGSINNLTTDTLKNEFKLTEKSYLTHDFINNPWYEIFRNDIESSKIIIFIGYSFKYDLDIKRLFVSESIKNKVFFINGEKMTNKEENILLRFGNILKYDSEKFSKEIELFKKNYLPQQKYSKPLYAFEKYDNIKPKYLKKITHNDILKLLYTGEFSQELYFSNLKEKYLFARGIKKNILKDIENGKKIIVIHSDFGNGKTIFLETLKRELISFGNVYELKNTNEDYYNDLENIILNADQKSFIIIENYNNYFYVLKKIENLNNENLVLILTARSFIHDLTAIELAKLKYYSDDNSSEYSLNKLSKKEIESIITYFDNYDLWGNYSNKSYNDKRTIITNECNKSLASLLLKIFESPKITEQLEKIKNKMEGNIEKFLIVNLINNITNINLSKNDIISYLDLQGQFNKYLRNEDLGEIIVNNENKLKLKSSVLGKYFLDKYVNKEKIIDILISLMKKTDKYNSNTANNLKFTLIYFSNFQLLVGKITKDRIIRYYEEIKDLEYCKKNPFFWIQYANAQLSLKNFEIAELCLKNAYSYRKNDLSPHYDTCHARYLLEFQLSKEIGEKTYKVFKEAHNLLLYTKNQKSKWHFPFKQTLLYKKYYEKFYNTFSKEEKGLFLQDIVNMVIKMEEYNEARKNNNDDEYKKVILAEKELRNILKNNNIIDLSIFKNHL